MSDAQDAARYRWLRDQHWSKSTMAVVEFPGDACKLGASCPSGERLDALIDRLMATKPAPAPYQSALVQFARDTIQSISDKLGIPVSELVKDIKGDTK